MVGDRRGASGHELAAGPPTTDRLAQKSSASETPSSVNRPAASAHRPWSQ